MCGIAGQLNLRGAPLSRVRVPAMCSRIGHRGPDDGGQWHEGPAALGHTRLSIIDLSPRGRNPMANEDGTLQLVFNGEIYNFRELRDELKERGHRFRSATDGEVILHLYEEHGDALVEKLDGMFAFGLWDAVRRRLLLARDRFGVKPLYYATIGDELFFASEAKCFLAVDEFEAAVDPIALSEHLTFQNTFGDRTLLRGVKLLPAGTMAVGEAGQVNTRTWWDLGFDPQDDRPVEVFARDVRDCFERAVERQLVSDVPVGTFLSGGMDTGAISAVAARAQPDMHSFTCGFEVPEGASDLEQYFDERPESYRLAALLGTQHHETSIDAGSMARSVASVAWHLDEPRVGISYQVWVTAALVRRFVKVVLSGVGGDELFAGYPWRYEGLLDLERPDFDRAYYLRWVRLLDDEQKNRLFAPPLRDAVRGFSSWDSFRDVMKQAPDTGNLDRALYFDFKTFLNGLLVVDDRLSMAHSVEARVPFLDNELVDLCSRIPARYKLRDGVGKWIFREAMRGLLPDETLARRKQGFTPPDETWFRGESLEVIRGVLLSPRALDRGYFEPSELRRILDDHVAARSNHRFLIWSFLCFEYWNRYFVDREPEPVHTGES